ncbi:MAG: hypothetical protein QE263_00725 [Vampirovibrionales bacterium]|nr:hypothetical protein [Vampirovibrionales bacterium]
MPEYRYRCSQTSCPSNTQSLLHTHGMDETPLLTCLVCGHWLVKQPQAATLLKSTATDAATKLDEAAAPKPPHVCSGPSCAFHHVDDWFATTVHPTQ